VARGLLLWSPVNHFPHQRAIEEYRRALTFNPNLDEVHHQLGMIYIHIGLLDKAQQELDRALAINPSHMLARFRTGIVLHLQGQYEQALAILKTVPGDAFPATVGRQLAWTLFNLGRRDEAAAVIEESLRKYKDEGGQYVSMQAMFAAAAGDEARAEEKLALAAQQQLGYIHFHHTAYNMASAYALMGKVEPTLKWLQDAVDDGYPCYSLFENDPNLNSVRKDSRFIAFMARLKDQWERYKTTL
jgi:tetratricopeptide (TPR) repeat protein